ncbi:ubiquitin-like domain-containing CTD phosphatase 1 [Tieghemostelium lacteum]|uniref:protein-serine/threonine phosphatase n=1 Tax=Tieghemostelium lacteum TaxID=361077 RepID=A0A151ZD61_TIELA|nr:ubiquitin-like domain-containing CTD phosphatase 1 [Tieghemostelium lacteum]|eukprot:KYQ91871.1 ubiquitin-like domain-containing CTD phosphatase 1 [Tieghemostelium lacteum]
MEQYSQSNDVIHLNKNDEIILNIKDTSTIVTTSSNTLTNENGTTTTTTTTTTVVEIEMITIKVKWNGKEHHVELHKPSAKVSDLKKKLEKLTNVLSIRQKILGLSKGKQPTDETTIESLNISHNHSIIMMGTPEANIIQDADEEDNGVFNDFEFDYLPDSDEISHLEKNKLQLEQMKVKATEISLMNEPRPGKKLLVLDLDHTILDFKDQDVLNMKRPYLDDFLTTIYEHFDIAIWSQTSWKWIDIKLSEMGMLTNPKYKISFVMDQTLMFSVTTYRNVNGKDRTKFKHQVKALDIIWSHKHLGKYYTPKNTLHVDDLSRNFAMNPKNGVHIPPFKLKDVKKHLLQDSVLLYLTKYLKSISSEEDFSKINHSTWLQKSTMN